MRWGVLLLVISAVASGCTTNHFTRNASNNSNLRHFRSAPSAALAFNPPVAEGIPELDLEREGRSTEAFVGFESISATYFHIRTDDRQLDYGFTPDRNFDRFERRAVSTKVGAIYR